MKVARPVLRGAQRREALGLPDRTGHEALLLLLSVVDAKRKPRSRYLLFARRFGSCKRSVVKRVSRVLGGPNLRPERAEPNGRGSGGLKQRLDALRGARERGPRAQPRKVRLKRRR